MENTNQIETVTQPKQKRAYHRRAPTIQTTTKQTLEELNLANNKLEEYRKIIENLKTQNNQLEQQLKNTIIKNKAAKEYLLDCIKHAYLSASMLIKEGE